MREVPAGWRWGEPLPGQAPVVEVPIARRAAPAAAPARRRPVYGRVYELFTDDPRDGEHPYAGQVKAPRTIAQRAAEHRSAAEVARFPWKARIVAGPRGYRLLETVYATGDEATDDRELDRAEAFWIDRLKTTHNGVRPVRPRAGDPLPPRPKEKSAPVRRAPRKRRPTNWRLVAFLAITAPCVTAVAWMVSAMEFQQGWVPWAVSPPLGAFFGWVAFDRLLKAGRKLRLWR